MFIPFSFTKDENNLQYSNHFTVSNPFQFLDRHNAVRTWTKLSNSPVRTGVACLYLWCKCSVTLPWRLLQPHPHILKFFCSLLFLSCTLPVSWKWVTTLEIAILFRWSSRNLLWHCSCTFAYDRNIKWSSIMSTRCCWGEDHGALSLHKLIQSADVWHSASVSEFAQSYDTGVEPTANENIYLH